MTLKKDIKCKFKIVDITLDKIESDKIKLCDNYLNFDYTSDQKIDEEYSNSNNIIKAKRMVLCDENNDEFEIFIKDKKLEINKKTYHIDNVAKIIGIIRSIVQTGSHSE